MRPIACGLFLPLFQSEFFVVSVCLTPTSFKRILSTISWLFQLFNCRWFCCGVDGFLAVRIAVQHFSSTKNVSNSFGHGDEKYWRFLVQIIFNLFHISADIFDCSTKKKRIQHQPKPNISETSWQSVKRVWNEGKMCGRTKQACRTGECVRFSTTNNFQLLRFSIYIGSTEKLVKDRKFLANTKECMATRERCVF